MAPAPRFFLSRRVGRHNEDLAPFELALGEVEINRLNLMAVSGIMLQECERVSRDQGVEMLKAGGSLSRVRA